MNWHKFLLQLLALEVSLSLALPPAAPARAEESGPVLPQMIWASIVTGEAGPDFWPDGMRLVAWTLRAHSYYWNIPPEEMGAGHGWWGWHEPTPLALEIVAEVWDADPLAAPYDFMQQGEMCVHLGSYQDSQYWAAKGFYDGTPDFRLSFGKQFSLDCYFTRMKRPKPADERTGSRLR